MLLGAFIGGWEVILILTIVLMLYAAKQLPELGRGLREGLDAFRKVMDEVCSELRRDLDSDPSHSPGTRFSLRVFIAEGFGVGKIPFAPGTFGSFAALLWFALLVWTGNFWTYLALAVEGIAFSLWLCDDAEKITGKEDPSSVVLDEIVAIPFCFLPWVAMEWWRNDTLPSVAYFFSGRAIWLTLAIVVLFRIFDIWKPWPVRQSQSLPGGWGVTVDDLLAAVYVAILSVPLLQLAL